MTHLRHLLSILPVALLLAGCPDDGVLTGGECVTDSDCVQKHGEGFVCSDEFRPTICLCTTDAACPEGEFCNAAGACQANVGCNTNDECDDDQVCDTTQSRCIERNRCTSDLHCPIGTLCNQVNFRCEPGCRVNGDCPLRQVCRCPENDPECDVGRCEQDLCDDQTFCELKELCELDDELGDTVCVEDTRGPYCQQCERTPGGGLSGACEAPANYCLVDTSVPGGRGNFCGVDCSDGQPCPNGFGCHYVVILTQALCSSDSQCPATGGACTTDDDCPGGRCDLNEMRCAGRCIGSEGGAGGTGFCSCVQDLDCPQDTCDTTDQVCGLTREPCQTGGDQCRGQLSCVNINGVGGCVIGRNCAPDEGISCAEVRAQ